MKIKEPTTEIPKKGIRGTQRTIYSEIYKRIDSLNDDEWLPIEFNDKKKAYNFRVACDTHRNRLMEAQLRGRTVYVRNKKL